MSCVANLMANHEGLKLSLFHEVVIVFDHVVHVCDLPQFDLCWLRAPCHARWDRRRSRL